MSDLSRMTTAELREYLAAREAVDVAREQMALAERALAQYENRPIDATRSGAAEVMTLYMAEPSDDEFPYEAWAALATKAILRRRGNDRYAGQHCEPGHLTIQQEYHINALVQKFRESSGRPFQAPARTLRPSGTESGSGVSRVSRDLKAAGLLKVRRGEGHGSANVYTLLIPAKAVAA